MGHEPTNSGFSDVKGLAPLPFMSISSSSRICREYVISVSLQTEDDTRHTRYGGIQMNSK